MDEFMNAPMSPQDVSAMDLLQEETLLEDESFETVLDESIENEVSFIFKPLILTGSLAKQTEWIR
jgi:hypothetical protein